MITQKVNLLQRVRVVMIALVAVIGFGTMAMKPAERLAAHTYGVAETSGGLNWRIVSDVTDRANNPYICNDSNETCTITSDQQLSPGTSIPKNQSLVLEEGHFVPLN